MSLAVMIDLETLGITSRAPILSMAAVSFCPEDIRAKMGQMYMVFEHPHFRDYELDPETVRWWLHPEQAAAREGLFPPVLRPIKNGLVTFAVWYTQLGAPPLWAHGASFDIPILEHAFRVWDVKPTWSFRDVRDTRTLFHMVWPDGRAPGPPLSKGVKHNALTDAINQAGNVCTALAELKRRMINV